MSRMRGVPDAPAITRKDARRPPPRAVPFRPEHGTRAGRRRTFLPAVLALAPALACADANGPETCAGDAIPLSGAVCIDLDAAGGLAMHRSVIEAEVARTLDAGRELLPITDLRVSIIADPAGVIPEIGLGGFNPSADEVRIFGDPGLPDVEGIITRELMGILSHEIHHALRRRAIGYGSTLLEAAVSEGLADHFALEAGGGDPPPWATALTDEQLAVWLPQVVAGTRTGYDHPAWFLGASADIPRWTGYAVGFELVRAYLDGNPGTSASGLVGEPAASFVPAGFLGHHAGPSGPAIRTGAGRSVRVPSPSAPNGLYPQQ